MDNFYNKNSYLIEDIDSLIKNEVEENLYLDYKRSEALTNKKEIAKDVSAFANSAGGLIIYGIEEGNHKPLKYSFIDGNKITKEWLEQIINSNIQRRINNIEIFPIRYNGEVEKTIYVVKIPESFNAPHLSNDKFYRRYNFESIPMLEYEIRNLYNKKNKTVLEIGETIITIGGNSMKNKNEIHKDHYSEYNIAFQVKNISLGIEQLYKLEIHLPDFMKSADYNKLNDYFIREENGYKIFSVQNSTSLFQNEITTIEHAKLRIFGMSLLNETNFTIRLKLYYSNGIDEKEFDVKNKMLDLWYKK